MEKSSSESSTGRKCSICETSIIGNDFFDWHNRYFCSKGCMDKYGKTLSEKKETTNYRYINMNGGGGVSSH